MQNNLKQIQKSFIKQRYQSDCGVACLLSIIRFYGGNDSLERLREQSGTTLEGTSMLGLYQTANAIGFEAKGIRGDIQDLKQTSNPKILYFSLENGFEHSVVYYGFDEEKGYLIGDPGEGIEYLSENEMDKLWKKKIYLQLNPNESFKTTKEINKDKRNLFLELLKDDQNLLLFSIIIGIGIAILGIAMSIFSQELIDNILPSHNINKLIFSIILLSLLLIFRVGFSVLREFILIRQTKQFNSRINDHFFKNLLLLPKFFFDSRKIGELVARLNDTQRVQDVIKSIINTTALDLMNSFVSIVFLFIYSWQVALITIAILPLYFYLIYRNRSKINTSQRLIMQAYALNESNYIDSLQGISTVKNSNKQNIFKQNNYKIFNDFQDRIYKLGLINIKMSWQAGLAGVLFLIVILTYTTINVLHENLKLGELMAILGISSSMLPSITNLALVFIPINEAKVAFSRMFEIISIEKEDEKGCEIDSLERIKLIDVSFRFPGRKLLFEHLNITMTKGTITAIIGESGKGKSTLGNILQKFYFCESGEIIINERSKLSEIATQSWRNKIGVIPQEIHIFNGNVLYNIVLGENYNQELLEKIVTEYGLIDFVLNLPNGFMTLIGEEGINLSGGQKQIIGLLRVLYKQPQFYILDEPTSALDKKTEQIVADILQKIKKNSIILFIGHKLTFINDNADFVYELN